MHEALPYTVGYRHISLRAKNDKPLPNGTIFVHITKKTARESASHAPVSRKLSATAADNATLVCHSSASYPECTFLSDTNTDSSSKWHAGAVVPPGTLLYHGLLTLKISPYLHTPREDLHAINSLMVQFMQSLGVPASSGLSAACMLFTLAYFLTSQWTHYP